MTEEEMHMVSIINQAKANVECENLKISEDYYWKVFEKHFEKENQSTNPIIKDNKILPKRKELKNGNL